MEIVLLQSYVFVKKDGWVRVVMYQNHPRVNLYVDLLNVGLTDLV